MAGLGEACSHVGALLFMMVGATDLGLNKGDTCTDVPSQWANAYCKEIVPKMLKDVDFSRPQYGKARRIPMSCPNTSFSSSSSDEDLWDIVAECAHDAVLLTAIDPSAPSNLHPIGKVIFIFAMIRYGHEKYENCFSVTLCYTQASWVI